MTVLKRGDVVVCVETDNPYSTLIEGDVYEVTATKCYKRVRYVQIVGAAGIPGGNGRFLPQVNLWWKQSRFMLVGSVR